MNEAGDFDIVAPSQRDTIPEAAYLYFAPPSAAGGYSTSGNTVRFLNCAFYNILIAVERYDEAVPGTTGDIITAPNNGDDVQDFAFVTGDYTLVPDPRDASRSVIKLNSDDATLNFDFGFNPGANSKAVRLYAAQVES